MTLPTGTTAPSSACNAEMVPVRGAGISTFALSVMTSTIGWSSLIGSPTLTSQRTISPSATPSPMSGNFTSNATRLSSVNEVEAADLAFLLVEPRAALAERAVLGRALALELLVQHLARPTIRDHESPRVAQVLHERRA